MLKSIMLVLTLFLAFSFSSTTLASDVQVYLTRTGSKYHLEWCRTIANSYGLRLVTVQQAKKQGYGACGVCKPPR